MDPVYLYDPHKRLQRKQYNDEADGYIAFVYEGQKLVRVENRSQGVNEDHVYGYDDAYRTASEVQGPRGTVRWAYDVRDQVSQMSVDGGPTTDYSYYPDGSMDTITWSLVAGEFKYRYTEEGQYETVTFPNGQTRNYTYDWAGRLLQLANIHPTAGNLATYSYGYDVDWATGLKARKGQRTSMTADVPAQGFTGALTKYLYDSRYQLTGADYPATAPFNGEVARWTYDAIGNRTSNTLNGVTANYTYQKLGANPKNCQRLASDGQRLFVHDGNGAIVRATGTQEQIDYAYRIGGRLASAASATGSFAYGWDFRMRRASRSDSSGSEAFLHNGSDVVATSTGATTQQYLYGPDVDEPLILSDDGQIMVMVVDGLGSTTMSTALGTGESMDSLILDAWGSRLPGSLAANGRKGFAAREAEIGGLWFHRMRVYDPAVGRFDSEDPLRFDAGMNFYTYAVNDPANGTDPFGLEVVKRAAYVCCDGKVPGGFTVCTNKSNLSKIFVSCIAEHEKDHVDYLQKNPNCMNQCQGKKKGDNLFTMTRAEQEAMECRGYSAEIKCLNSQRTKSPSKATEIFGRINQLKNTAMKEGWKCTWPD